MKKFTQLIRKTRNLLLADKKIFVSLKIFYAESKNILAIN
ncbi:hypothetical protein APHACPA_1264 [Rickettsia amblyommatis str. Ac/Pa]|uniref:Uncharacterized protein n=1 Tax=Rickettsia amblyommatis str. Ac/Pa TaxID=1359164 RepID=A0A0F3N2J6_RICAM|nr:hypothetical protein APHACPA_1264 [Rickettsia amblyommatis str. Ac/Pa]